MIRVWVVLLVMLKWCSCRLEEVRLLLKNSLLKRLVRVLGVLLWFCRFFCLCSCVLFWLMVLL